MSGPSAQPPGPPTYKGEPLDAERGPGLGCFWAQVIVLAVLLVLTPLTVVWAWDPLVSAILLFATLALLFFAGQTVIFLLRLVAADRRSRRRPLSPAARRTVGQLEDDAAIASPDSGSGEDRGVRADGQLGPDTRHEADGDEANDGADADDQPNTTSTGRSQMGAEDGR